MVDKKFDKIYGWLFILPVFILAVVFFLIPAGMSLILSFKEYSLLDSQGMFSAPWVGLNNYKEVFKDEIFFKSLKNTVIYSLGVVPTQLIIALGLAIICNSKIRNKGLLRTIYYIPTVTSAVAVSIMFLFLYKTDGLLNKFLGLFGVEPIGWFNSPAFALPSMMSLAVWSSVGIYMVIFLAGLQGISPSLYEAAEIDGASKFEQFLYVTLPQLKHVLFFNLVVSFIGTLQVFDQAYVISGGTGGPLDSTSTVVLYLFNSGFRDFKMGYASAIAFVLFGIIFTLTMIQKFLFKESD
ncbi:sugar ABC transporter permease [uncultured Cetobacterium sp.]|uniref:carbohydrate ABC transporter permease n=1 Tax=uncultured Cetobacterium sp. TaxID=527638 RepID=UPI0025F44E05|nr:sugar ABC transporter permease [uncultured Cetobacterium sp.]